MAIIYVPLAFLANQYFGITGIFAAYAIANFASGIVAYFWARASVQEQCDAHAEPLILSESV
jgi:Na+-driven multidrug efflux pump